jgi:transcriptional regulator with XRE-family HTH domain
VSSYILQDFIFVEIRLYENGVYLLYLPNLRRLREKAGLSQEELAARAGLARTYISGIENGRRNPTVIVLYEIATQLGADPRELLDPTITKE